MALILVVDDEQAVREVFEAFLALDGHATVCVPDVQTAISALEREHFDLVLTDLRLPAESGLDLLEVVASRWSETPVVLVTGHPSRETASSARELGAVGYVAKPLRGSRLREIVATVLDRKPPGWLEQ